MERLWATTLWRQMGAAIAMLERAIIACPDELWTLRLWPAPADEWESGFPAPFGEFWYLSFHTAVWIDFYLTGGQEEEFRTPPPFPQGEMDSDEVLPAQPYTKDEVLTYLGAVRERCFSNLTSLTEEQASRPIQYPWSRGETVSYLELQVYNLRHVQEHVAQLNLFLGQHGVPSAQIRWVARAKSDLNAR